MPAYPFVGSLGWRVPTDQVRPRRLLSKQSGFSSLCDRRLGASGGRARGKGRRTCRTRRCPTPTSTSALARSASYFDAPFLLIALGERTLPSGLAGALAPTSPILIGIFAPFIGRSERISRRQGVALSVGALMTFPVAVVTAPRQLPDVRAVLVVLGTGSGFTAGTFMLYYSLINQVGEERATIAQYFAPAFALFYGALWSASAR
jgi:hypothetical protein